MPKPGARPYECIRRAWHSDEHLTLRGTLIQEIFRVVNEIHCPETRKKKEWQEKLPMVVLRAEDILYSKANSEGEYMDLKTLCSRLNDSINTMIRRDVSTEGGQFLEPCVEAALSLGCLPKKGTRGQRHSSRSSEGGNQKPSMSSSPSAMGNSGNYKCSEDKVKVQSNGVHLSSLRPAYHCLDPQHYILPSIPAPVVCPGSLFCSPTVVTVPSRNGSHLFSPGPQNRGHIETLLNFKQETVPANCCPQFYEQTYPGGPQLATIRTESGPICVPLLCPQLSTSTINTRGIPSPYMMNVSSPCSSSQMRYIPQTDPAPHLHPPCRHLQTVTGHPPSEGLSSEEAQNTHDLQLRLGPPGNTNTSFSIVATHTSSKDPCSINAWTQGSN